MFSTPVEGALGDPGCLRGLPAVVSCLHLHLPLFPSAPTVTGHPSGCWLGAGSASLYPSPCWEGCTHCVRKGRAALPAWPRCPPVDGEHDFTKHHRQDHSDRDGPRQKPDKNMNTVQSTKTTNADGCFLTNHSAAPPSGEDQNTQ